MPATEVTSPYIQKLHAKKRPPPVVKTVGGRFAAVASVTLSGQHLVILI